MVSKIVKQWAIYGPKGVILRTVSTYRKDAIAKFIKSWTEKKFQTFCRNKSKSVKNRWIYFSRHGFCCAEYKEIKTKNSADRFDWTH